MGRDPSKPPLKGEASFPEFSPFWGELERVLELERVWNGFSVMKWKSARRKSWPYCNCVSQPFATKMMFFLTFFFTTNHGPPLKPKPFL